MDSYKSGWPIYTGRTLPMDSWRGRMWLDTWVWQVKRRTRHLVVSGLRRRR